MKGLLIKDFRTIMNNNRTFILLMIAVVFVMVFATDSPEFVLGYLGVVGAMLALGTITYDQFDNGMPFLFTLPVTRKMYVTEKYLFSALFSVALSCSVYIIVFAVGLIRGVHYDASSPFGMIAGCLLFMFIMIPLQLKFGVEKARIALVAVFGGFAAIITAVTYIGAGNGIFYEDIKPLFEGAKGVPQFVIIVIAMMLVAICGIVSYSLSVKIMENKEY